MNGDGKTYVRSNGSTFFGDSRSEKKANKNLGIKLINGASNTYRSETLKCIDDYLYGVQYSGLADWQEVKGQNEGYVEIRKRKPSMIYPFAKVFKDRVGSKLAGASTFPTFKVEDDEETEYLINKVIIPAAFFEPKMLELAKNFALRNSAFMRFKFKEGNLQLEEFNANYCYPRFGADGKLNYIEIKYVYATGEIDNQGRVIQKWFRLELTVDKDILYHEEIYDPNVKEEPEWKVKEQVEHKLGYVQGQWFRNGEGNIDGSEDAIIYDSKEFIDAINYNLSQSDSATSYGLDPQLTMKGMDEDDVECLIKSSEKAWLLGQDGEAGFLEVSGAGVTTAKETREDQFKRFADIVRIVFLDPEKMVASAQSGKAMEVMHGPLVELINELRPWMEKGMIELLQKIVATIVTLNIANVPTEFTIPRGWVPKSLDITATWPPIFELTTQDKQGIVSLAIQAVSANIISRDTSLKWMQSQGVDFGVEDFDLEVQKVNSQQQFNTFGF